MEQDAVLSNFSRRSLQNLAKEFGIKVCLVRMRFRSLCILAGSQRAESFSFSLDQESEQAACPALSKTPWISCCV